MSEQNGTELHQFVANPHGGYIPPYPSQAELDAEEAKRASQIEQLPPQVEQQHPQVEQQPPQAQVDADHAKRSKGKEKAPSPEDDDTSTTVEETMEKLGTTKDGLSSAEVSTRQQKYGKNALQEKKRNPLKQFFGLMWNPLSWAMEVAAILSVIVADWPDFGLILGLLILNSSIAYYEETQAGNAINALKAQLTPKATAKRDGTFTVIDASELVPGDVVRVKLGDVAPADLKIIECENVKVDQAALTGESLPVSKDVNGEIFSGSALKMGEAECVVTETGMNTFFGRTAGLVAQTESSGHFQAVLRDIGYFCIIFIGIWVLVELLVQFVGRGYPCRITGYNDQCPALSNVIVLIVGGVPVAMPTVLSVTMAIGASKLAKRKAIVRRLTAVEELAGMDVLCSDKTGTLTLNKLTVDESWCVPGFSPDQVLFDAALASKQGDAIDDAIDIAIIGKLKESGGEEALHTYNVTKFSPFDPISKRTEATIMGPEGMFKAAKGAPQVILEISSNKEEIGESVLAQIEDFAGRGLRCIGIARTVDPEATQWVMSGLVPLFDPPREDTKETIETALKMGVGVKMITGDQLAIAKETARRLGMGSNIYSAATFLEAEKAEKDANKQSRVKQHEPKGSAGTKSEFTKMIEEADGFAQVFPETKYEIVSRLQKAHHTVGMTGDGVNDAPALKKANVGIAVAGATDAARAAADIVLTSPGLHVIIDAFIGSRKTFQRMKHYAIYSITMTIRMVLTFGILTVAWDFMFPTIIIVIVAILNDGTILTISTDKVHPSPEPDKWNLPEIFTLSALLGAWLVGATLLLFVLERHTFIFQDWFDMRKLTDPELRGLLYLYISASGQATIFCTRTRRFSYGYRPSYLLLGAFVLAQVIATFIGVYGLNGYPNNGLQDFQGCGWGFALVAWIWVLIFFLPMDLIKIAVSKYIFKRDMRHVRVPFHLRQDRKSKQTQKEEEKGEHKLKGKEKRRENAGKIAPTPLGMGLEVPRPRTGFFKEKHKPKPNVAEV